MAVSLARPVKEVSISYLGEDVNFPVGGLIKLEDRRNDRITFEILPSLARRGESRETLARLAWRLLRGQREGAPVTSKPKYRGELARRIYLHREPGARLIEAFIRNANAKELTGEKYQKRFDLLMKHYSIPVNNPACWFRLAQCLAFDHVPGFQVSDKHPVGRPRSGGGKVLAKQKVGRPPTRRNLAPLIHEWCENWKKQTGVTGRGSSKKAIEALLEEHVKDTGRSKHDVFARGLKKFQKIYSEARKGNLGVNSRNQK